LTLSQQKPKVDSAGNDGNSRQSSIRSDFTQINRCQWQPRARMVSQYLGSTETPDLAHIVYNLKMSLKWQDAMHTGSYQLQYSPHHYDSEASQATWKILPDVRYHPLLMNGGDIQHAIEAARRCWLRSSTWTISNW
jgi:hypothetical protein